jgi:hypothetical protein
VGSTGSVPLRDRLPAACRKAFRPTVRIIVRTITYVATGAGPGERPWRRWVNQRTP